jgi:hypothetical protein
MTTARVIHKKAADDLRRYTEKLRAVLPIHPVLIDKPKVRFMHQRSSFERVSTVLRQHVTASQSAKLAIHERKQCVEGGAVSTIPIQ